jgi:hypothetical protein
MIIFIRYLFNLYWYDIINKPQINKVAHIGFLLFILHIKV